MTYPQDDNQRQRLVALLEEVWPGLAAAITRAAQLGVPWHGVSTPFVCFAGNRLVAHAGVLELPMRIAGVDTVVGGIHAVCTQSDFRGRGYNRQVMEAALSYCDDRFETTLLYANDPALYRRYGFRSLTQHCFSMPTATLAPEPKSFRPLHSQNPADLALLKELLKRRTPISNWLAVLDRSPAFIINELLCDLAFKRLYYAPDLNCIAAFELEGQKLRLVDLVALDLPPLSQVLARLPATFKHVEIHFSPDRFDLEGLSIHPETEDHLMVRGPFAAPARPFIVPPLGRC